MKGRKYTKAQKYQQKRNRCIRLDWTPNTEGFATCEAYLNAYEPSVTIEWSDGTKTHFEGKQEVMSELAYLRTEGTFKRDMIF